MCFLSTVFPNAPAHPPPPPPLYFLTSPLRDCCEKCLSGAHELGLKAPNQSSTRNPISGCVHTITDSFSCRSERVSGTVRKLIRYVTLYFGDRRGTAQSLIACRKISDRNNGRKKRGERRLASIEDGKRGCKEQEYMKGAQGLPSFLACPSRPTYPQGGSQCMRAPPSLSSISAQFPWVIFFARHLNYLLR